MDPLASFGEECGKISESQEELLARAPFLNDPPSAAAAAAADDDEAPIFLSSSSSDGAAVPHATAPMRPADAPIRICSPPASPTPGADLGLAEALRLDEAKGKPPTAEPSKPTAPKAKSRAPVPSGERSGSSRCKKAVVRRRARLRGAQINTDADDLPNKESLNPTDIDKYRYQSLEHLEDLMGNPKPASGSRTMTASIVNPSSEEGNARTENQARAGPTAAGSSAAGHLPDFPATLLDFIKAFSAKPNRRFADADILEIAKMKGIEFPRPSWWRPEGYELKFEKQKGK